MSASNLHPPGAPHSAALRPAPPRLPLRAVANLNPELGDELQALATELDPELYAEGLLNLAQRQEQAGRVELAAELYAEIVGAGSHARPAAAGTASGEGGRGALSSLQARARCRLEALTGRGAFGARAEFLLRNFSQQAADPAMLFAMGAAGAVFRLTRLGVLSRLTMGSGPGVWTRLLGAGRMASLAGFAVEAPTFTLAGRLGNVVLGREQEWSRLALGRELASSYLVLGGLKLAGWATGAAYQGVSGFRTGGAVGGAVRVQPLQVLFQQAGMLAGILIGHRAEAWAGLREHRDGATTLLDSLALLLQFNVVGRLSRQVFGENFARWERELDAHAEALSRLPAPSGPRPPFAPPALEALNLDPLPLGPKLDTPGREVLPRGLEPLFMVGRPRGPGDWRQTLNRAAELRRQIAPKEAFEHRADRATEYLALIAQLPNGHGPVLEEILNGVAMFGEWAEGGDAFRKAIAYRHYGEMWGMLADRWSHLSMSIALTEAFQTEIHRHLGLLGTEGNLRFLVSALRAAPQIARVYSHTLGALVEGSPRERALTGALRTLLENLRGMTLAPSRSALRGKTMEAWHETLNNTANEHEGFARLALEGVKIARTWIGAPDVERQELGRKYFPLFWERMGDRPEPRLKDALLSDVQEEAAYLHQTLTPKGVATGALLATLRAYPSYTNWVFHVLGTEPMNTYMFARTFVGQARGLLDWVRGHPDGEVRNEAAQTYQELMAQLVFQANELAPLERQLPTRIRDEVMEQLLNGVEVFAQRYQAPRIASADYLTQTLKAYLELVELVPAEERYGRELTAELNLKPLVRLAQRHGDPRVRKAAEDVLERILKRFSPPDPSRGSSN